MILIITCTHTPNFIFGHFYTFETFHKPLTKIEKSQVAVKLQVEQFCVTTVLHVGA